MLNIPRTWSGLDGAKIALPLMNRGTVAHHASRAVSRGVNSSVDVFKLPRQLAGGEVSFFKVGKAELWKM